MTHNFYQFACSTSHNFWTSKDFSYKLLLATNNVRSHETMLWWDQELTALFERNKAANEKQQMQQLNNAIQVK